MARLLTVYVGKASETNLKHGLKRGIWGFKKEVSKDILNSKDLLDEDTYLLIGSGYSGGSPRVKNEKWLVNNLSSVYLAKINSNIFEDDTPEWDDESALDADKRYSIRFRFDVNTLTKYSNILLSTLPEEISENLRRSAIAQSRGYISEDFEPSLFRQILSEDRLRENLRRSSGANMRNHMNVLNAIKTKPLILLAGMSGTGKSRLARTLAFKTCAREELSRDPRKPGNFELIPVKPDWHDSSELIGYVSRISGEKYITTAFLRFIGKAWQNLNIPFFICLDEMNLAPVEQYFAEYLSIVETRQTQDTEIVTDFLIAKTSFENPRLYDEIVDEIGLKGDPNFSYGIGIPQNLVVVGTVNMDETTHSFSRKVLDRAMTFEMNEVDLNEGLDKDQNDWSYPQEFVPKNEVIGEFTSGADVFDRFSESKEVIKFLQQVNIELEDTPFKIAYRLRDEFLIYCYYASRGSSNQNWLTLALDEMVCMKVLSRIEGDESRTGEVLKNLQRILDVNFAKSNKKIREMETRLQKSGYTSFWF